MSMDDISLQALERANRRDEYIHIMREMNRMRATGKTYHWSEARCPCCQTLVVRKVEPTGLRTIVWCPRCSWNHVLDFAMDEGRLVTEPGKQARPRVAQVAVPGQVTVELDLSGKIKSVRGG